MKFIQKWTNDLQFAWNKIALFSELPSRENLIRGVKDSSIQGIWSAISSSVTWIVIFVLYSVVLSYFVDQQRLWHFCWFIEQAQINFWYFGFCFLIYFICYQVNNRNTIEKCKSLRTINIWMLFEWVPRLGRTMRIRERSRQLDILDQQQRS